MTRVTATPRAGSCGARRLASAASGCTAQRAGQGQTRAEAGQRGANNGEGECTGAVVPWSEMSWELGKVRA